MVLILRVQFRMWQELLIPGILIVMAVVGDGGDDDEGLVVQVVVVMMMAAVQVVVVVVVVVLRLLLLMSLLLLAVVCVVIFGVEMSPSAYTRDKSSPTIHLNNKSMYVVTVCQQLMIGV